MAINVRYQINATKTYNYQQEILVDTSININFTFYANVNNPEEHNLIPYYKSIYCEKDSFFQKLLAHNLKFSHSAVDPQHGQDRDNNHCSWTETYMRIRSQHDLHDVQIEINYPCWKIKFFDFHDYERHGESRRLRQIYGYTPVSGSLRARLKSDPGPWTTWFASGYNPSKLIVDNIVTQKSWENNEFVWNISLNWKSYDLFSIPSFKELWN